MYHLEISDLAKRHIAEFKKSDTQSFKKVSKLLNELVHHPTIGTGQPEMLKGNFANY